VRWCADHAPALGARVVAALVVEPPAYLIPPTGLAPAPGLDEARRGELRSMLRDEWCAPLDAAGVPFEAHVLEGSPAWELEALADELDADMIVVGRHGHGGIKQLMLGSVAHRLAHHAARPVVVVPG
jgi:nucleotide-binding universal stress UspA family protein